MGHHVRERKNSVRSFVTVEETSLRARMEAAIEIMLALLDDLDGEPDLEPEENEIDLDDEGEDDDPREEDDPLEDSEESEDEPDVELTALERYGAGFIYSGGDDEEEGYDRENDVSEAGIGDIEGYAEQCGVTGFGQFAWVE